MENVGVAIDPDSRDMTFGAQGDICMLRGLDMVVQCIRVTLQVYKGEWELDERHGTDYESVMGVKPRPADSVIESIIREAVFQETEVRRIGDIQLTHVGGTLCIQIRGVLKSGETFDLEVGE